MTQLSQGGMPRPGKAVVGLLVANTVLYVLEVILIRAGIRIDELLFLHPAKVFDEGWAWQPFTYVLFHSPLSAGHLVMNMLMLWIFGSTLEQRWSSKKVLITYAVSALAGSMFTLAVALLSRTPVLSWLVPDFYNGTHVGASGATMGLTIAWAVLFANERMTFLFMGQMKGRTFAMILIGMEILFALSLDNTSSTSHFGGMMGGFFMVKGLWRLSSWGSLFRGSDIERRRRKIEAELRLIEGGKGKGGGDDLPN